MPTATDPNAVQARAQRIHQEIALTRGMQKKIMPFAYCWNRLKQQKPELFDGLDKDSGPPPTSLGDQRPGPHFQVRPRGRRT
jgi:hypothetical protein